MEYDELVFKLYEIARESDDPIIEEQMTELGWSVKKNGIYDEDSNTSDGIYFKDLINQLQKIADQAKVVRDQVKLEDFKDELVAEGLKGYVKKYWNY